MIYSLLFKKCDQKVAGRNISLRSLGAASFLLALVACLFNSQAVLAMEDTDDIDTNRPSFMASPLVVPKGSLQLENGVLYQHFQHGTNYYDASETEARLGLTKSTELQMYVPNWVLMHHAQSNTVGFANGDPDLPVLQSSAAYTQNGVADLTDVGIKQQLPITAVKNLTVSIITAVTIPTGRRLISGSGVQPAVRMPWMKGISKNWSIGGMQSILVENSGRDVGWQNFWMLNRAFGARTSAFAEYGGFYAQRASASNIIHFGVVRKLNKNTQIDMQWGFGLDKTAPAAFIGAGYSFRMDHLPLIDKI